MRAQVCEGRRMCPLGSVDELATAIGSSAGESADAVGQRCRVHTAAGSMLRDTCKAKRVLPAAGRSNSRSARTAQRAGPRCSPLVPLSEFDQASATSAVGQLPGKPAAAKHGKLSTDHAVLRK